MFDLTLVNQPSKVFELFHDVFVSILDVLAFEVSHRINKFPSGIYWTNDFLALFYNSSGKAYSIIIFTMIWGLKVLLFIKKI